MLWSQLRSYRPGIVHMLMEGNDARLKDESADVWKSTSELGYGVWHLIEQNFT